MADSAFSKVKEELVNSPATDRLKQELQSYLTARAQHAVTGLGQRLGEGVGSMAEGKGGGLGGAAKTIAKAGQQLGEGKSPAQVAMSAGASHVKDAVKEKVKGLFGKGRKSGGGKSKSVTISEDIDVGVPLREAYDQWTQFQEFSTFAKGVVSVEKADDTSSNWKVKVAKSTRSWKANVTEQVPDERITWTTEGAKGTVKGVVTFHAITDDLTRVLLVLEYFPKGLFEKTGNIWRAQGRRARLDLKLYRKFIMMRGEATDGWRGEIRDGEVVVGHDEAVEAEESQAEEDPDAEGTEPDASAEGGDEDDDAYADEEEGYADGEPEEDEEETAADEPGAEDGAEEEPLDGEEAEDAEDADEGDEGDEAEFDEEEEPGQAEDEDEYDDVEEPEQPEDAEEEPAPRSRRRTASARG